MVAVPVDQPADQVALSGEGEGCDDDEEGDIYIMMQCLCVTKNEHFPLPS